MFSMGSLKNTLMVVLIAVILTMIVIPSGEGHAYDDEEILKDQYFRIWINTREGDTIFYSVKVTEGSRIDVYYLNESESQRYVDGKTFLPDREHIGATSVEGEFRIPDDQDYMFVVDNLDNAQKNDTRPSDDVRVDVEIVSSLVIGEDSEPTLFRMMALPLIFLALGILAMRGDTYRRRRIRAKRKLQFLTGVRGGPFTSIQDSIQDPTLKSISDPTPGAGLSNTDPPGPMSLEEKRSRDNP